jgi:hypothetical protein
VTALDLPARLREDDDYAQFRLGMDENQTESVLFLKRKRKLPARSVIVKAWKDSELAIVPAWTDAERLCWRCGDPPEVCGRANLDRAHLVPHALGGTDDPTNIVLLCEECHHWGPNFINPKFMLSHVQQLVRLQRDGKNLRKQSTHELQADQMHCAWMILSGDVCSGKTTWRTIGNRFVELFKTKTVHHFARNGDLFADRIANSIAIFQTIIDELPDD